MPIRTNRGRAAVYRRLWSWPLRSPNHLIATIVGFAVVIIVFTSVIPAITKGARGGGANNAATSTSISSSLITAASDVTPTRASSTGWR